MLSQMHYKLSHMDAQRSVSVWVFFSPRCGGTLPDVVCIFLAQQLSHSFDLISYLARPQTRVVELYQYSLISILINQLVN